MEHVGNPWCAPTEEGVIVILHALLSPLLQCIDTVESTALSEALVRMVCDHLFHTAITHRFFGITIDLYEDCFRQSCLASVFTLSLSNRYSFVFQNVSSIRFSNTLVFHLFQRHSIHFSNTHFFQQTQQAIDASDFGVTRGELYE